MANSVHEVTMFSLGHLVGFLLHQWNGGTCETWSYHMGLTKVRATYP